MTLPPRLTRPAALDLVAQLQRELALQPPHVILAAAHAQFGPTAAISFSGTEDVALLGLAQDIGLPFRVFSLDTGRMHPETHALLQSCRERFAPDLEVFSPEANQVEALVRAKGLFSFRTEGHHECCGIRKVAPLRRALAAAPAWITGQRRDQSPDTRSEVPFVQIDESFSDSSGVLLKFNPLARWSSAQVWQYIRAAQLPFNALHAQGYLSIGCAPCTRPVLPGEHERAGRWWWEEATKKECGLHAVANAS